MKSIHRTIQRLALAALAATAFLSRAEAAPVVSISPATQTIGVGAPGSVNIIVSGLTQAVGGIQFDLSFNNTFLTAAGFVIDPAGKFGPFQALNDFSMGFVGGSLNVVYLPDLSFTTDAALFASEGASFTLATVNFMGLSAGVSPLTLSGVVLSNFLGDADLAGVTSVNGQICVGAAANCAVNPVPEPETIVLFATGLAALAIRRRRAKQ